MLEKEPAVLTGLLVSVATAIIVVLVAFNVHVDDAQTKAILGAIGTLGALLPILGSFVVRAKVSPVPQPPKPEPVAPLSDAEIAAWRAQQSTATAQVAWKPTPPWTATNSVSSMPFPPVPSPPFPPVPSPPFPPVPSPPVEPAPPVGP